MPVLGEGHHNQHNGSVSVHVKLVVTGDTRVNESGSISEAGCDSRQHGRCSDGSITANMRMVATVDTMEGPCNCAVLSIHAAMPKWLFQCLDSTLS